MVFCEKCGNKVKDEAKFCPKCGGVTRVEYSNGMAIVGFILSFFSPVLGWIFGGIGLRQAEERAGTGAGLSTAAIIVAIFGFLARFNSLFIYLLGNL